MITIALTRDEAEEVASTLRNCISSECGCDDWNDSTAVITAWRTQRERVRDRYRHNPIEGPADETINSLDDMANVLKKIATATAGKSLSRNGA